MAEYHAICTPVAPFGKPGHFAPRIILSDDDPQVVYDHLVKCAGDRHEVAHLYDCLDVSEPVFTTNLCVYWIIRQD